jgi:DNA-binding transcriptional LysR family regulator
MDQGVRFDGTQARAILATVEAGSLSKAARTLGLTQLTLSRQVARLEAALGGVLFERVGRALVLTQTGRSQALEGRVTISARDAFASMCWC